jgi:type IV pilus assembly protein PilA
MTAGPTSIAALDAQRMRARRLAVLAPERAYTLVELMVVVSIIGILATIAVFSIRKYIAAAKTAEATSMITSIRAAEESYRDETFKYLGLSNFSSWHPVDEPANAVYSWGIDNGTISTYFHTLGVQPAGPVRYVYTVVAGDVGDSIPELPTALKRADFNFPAVTGPFYVIVARANLKGSGHYSYALAHSYNSAVHIEE